MPRFGDPRGKFLERAKTQRTSENSPEKWSGLGFMDSSNRDKNHNSAGEENPISNDFYHTVKKELQEARDAFSKDLQQTRTSIELLIAGIHGELKGIVADIKEMKQMAKVNRRMIEKVSLKTPIARTNSSKVSTGLDILLQVPRHLRGTYSTVMKAERGGVTAQEVATQTGKSRPTESDYLNQLTDKGLISKVRSGKKVLFYYGERTGENGNGPNDSLNHPIKKARMAIQISDEDEI
jgi:DNA-binding transcriptional ArsR family regulator